MHLSTVFALFVALIASCHAIGWVRTCDGRDGAQLQIDDLDHGVKNRGHVFLRTATTTYQTVQKFAQPTEGSSLMGVVASAPSVHDIITVDMADGTNPRIVASCAGPVTEDTYFHRVQHDDIRYIVFDQDQLLVLHATSSFGNAPVTVSKLEMDTCTYTPLSTFQGHDTVGNDAMVVPDTRTIVFPASEGSIGMGFKPTYVASVNIDTGAISRSADVDLLRSFDDWVVDPHTARLYRLYETDRRLQYVDGRDPALRLVDVADAMFGPFAGRLFVDWHTRIGANPSLVGIFSDSLYRVAFGQTDFLKSVKIATVGLDFYTSHGVCQSNGAETALPQLMFSSAGLKSSAIHHDESTHHRMNIIYTVFGAIGGVIIAVAVTMYITSKPKHATDDYAEVQAAPHPDTVA